jgi:Universal stress protein UspA and related nucleotide-binding proteins
MRIVVGIDGEPASRTALDWVVAQPFAADAALTLVTSFDLLVSDVEQDAARLESEAARVRGSLPGGSVATALADGSIPEVLRRWAEDADLLVIGSRATTLRREALTGSLAERLAAVASVPVVVVPERFDAHPGDVVAGVAEDDSSDDAVEFAARLAEAQGLPLRLVHVWDRTPPATDPVSLYLSVPESQREAHEAHLRAVVDRVAAAHPGLELVGQLQEGRPPSAFQAPGRGIALLVIGTHRRGPIAAWVLGSVARALLADGGEAVCVVPPGSLG